MALPIALLAASACSDSSDSATCDAVQEVVTDFQDLRDVNVAQEGSGTLTDAVDELDQSLDTLATDASDQLRPTVDALVASIEAISDTVQSLGERPVGESIDTITAQVQAAATALGDLVDEARTGASECDIDEPSGS